MHADRPQPIPSRNRPAAASLSDERRRMDSGAQQGPHRNFLANSHASCAELVEVEQICAPPEDVAEARIDRHTITLHLGPAHSLAWGLAGANRERTHIPPGSLTLISAGTKLSWRRDQVTEALIVTLDPNFVAALADRPARDGDVEFHTLMAFEDPAITYILRAMQTALSGRCARSRLYDEALATALVSHLLSHYMVRPIKQEHPTGGLPVARLRRVLDYIEAHLGEDTSLRQLAELVRLSPDHFATLFRQSIGLPPHRYVLERRVARAKDLLARSPLSLAEIGYALGYTSQAHFITMFRRLAGLPPGAYRKLHGASSVGRAAVA